MTTNSPYFGQSVWFQRFHKEKLPDVIERYNNEIRRVLGVLDGVLANKEYLVGGKLTIADLSFVPWNVNAATRLLGAEFKIEKEYPNAAK